ncbi:MULTISPECIES: GIY-YIG nuclease family protein [unclassified Kribbella]|uniref:GIY-YIG nuclease family protein n=1 Tax=unclassified Kribbella TaxID=2644121 RepID=UPI0033C99BAA
MSSARTAARSLPVGPGVYRFRDATGKVLYVGRAVNLRRRVQSYWTNLGDRPRLRRMVERIDRVEGVWCDSAHEAAWLERNLLEHSKPRWNRTKGGQEVVGYIRYDEGPQRSELRFTHVPTGPAPHFGPYLGGVQVRLALSALHRVLPLTYAGTTKGSAREFAELLGVGAADRETLARTAIAVLEREPAAVDEVRGELERRRDRAAAELRFEFAAKLQEEIAAIDWIVAEQKVSWLEPREADVYGWAGGVLVQFRVRAGRMCTWTQRLVSEAVARDRVAATPLLWQAFAHRNAELASRLLRG